MSGSMGDMGNLLRQAQKMQKELDRVREELRQTTVEGIGGGGVVVATLSGDRRVVKIEIDPALAESGDKGRIEATVLQALNDGLEKAEALREKSMSRVTGGMSLPGLF
jgi:DNA-binding YbaB/EbfC family protein